MTGNRLFSIPSGSTRSSGERISTQRKGGTRRMRPWPFCVVTVMSGTRYLRRCNLNAKLGKHVNAGFPALAVEQGEHDPLQCRVVKLTHISFDQFPIQVFAIGIVNGRKIFIQRNLRTGRSHDTSVAQYNRGCPARSPSNSSPNARSPAPAPASCTPRTATSRPPSSCPSARRPRSKD